MFSVHWKFSAHLQFRYLFMHCRGRETRQSPPPDIAALKGRIQGDKKGSAAPHTDALYCGIKGVKGGSCPPTLINCRGGQGRIQGSPGEQLHYFNLIFLSQRP